MRVERFIYTPLQDAYWVPRLMFENEYHRHQDKPYFCEIEVTIDGQKIYCREVFPYYIPEYEARRKMEHSIMKEINGKLFGRS